VWDVGPKSVCQPRLPPAVEGFQKQLAEKSVDMLAEPKVRMIDESSFSNAKPFYKLLTR
jgi:hypothetical protein